VYGHPNPVVDQLGKIGHLCDDILRVNENARNAVRDRLQRANASLRHGMILAAAIIALMLAAGIGYALSLQRPLLALLHGVRRAGEGELDVVVTGVRRGELGELIRAFNRLTRNVRVQRQRLLRESVTDGLTGLFNQRHFRFLLEQEEERGRRAGTETALLMIDIDHFKRHNDQFGHEFGNRVIQTVARAIRTHLREADVLARYGGDELAVVLPNTARADARALAERIERGVAALRIGPAAGPVAAVTLSIGGASSPAENASELVERADAALYQAKRAGRACVRWGRGPAQTAVSDGGANATA
jgi:diguanylate cyclase (GGDEF)-like protein